MSMKLQSLAAASLFFAFAGAAMAQDPLKVGAGVYTLAFENERTRVCDIQFEPGEKVATHSHPDHMVYVLSAGTLEISKPDGSKSVVEATPGQILWIPAETHWAQNVGKTTLHAIVVEFKEKPAAAAASTGKATKEAKTKSTEGK